MTVLHKDTAAPMLATLMLVLMCYIAGRVHQFFKQTTEREDAYRDGYNTATRSLFGLATRSAKLAFSGQGQAQEAEPGQQRQRVVPMRGYASVPEVNRRPRPARHRAGGRRKESLDDTKRMDTAA